MILVISNESDITTDYVIRELTRRNVHFARLNSERLVDSTVSFRLQNGFDEFRFRVGERSVCIRECTAVYYRRPGVPKVGGLEQPLEGYAIGEYGSLLGGLYRLLEVRWINHPFAVERAESKILQLRRAMEIGFSVPATLVTNSGDVARDFLSTLNGDAIVKPLRSARLSLNGVDHIAFTSPLSSELIDHIDDLQLAPCILQQHIRKHSDVRVTVVGSRVFPVEIASQEDPAGRVDWRAGDAANLAYSTISLPPAIERQCLAITRAFDLEFSAIDLAVDLDGRYWFFEVNPNGQWAWLELATGAPIAEAIVDRLVDHGADS